MLIISRQSVESVKYAIDIYCNKCFDIYTFAFHKSGGDCGMLILFRVLWNDTNPLLVHTWYVHGVCLPSGPGIPHRSYILIQYIISKCFPDLTLPDFLRFCTFLVSSSSTFEYREDVQLLKRLAAGTDPAPDLLVTGKLRVLNWRYQLLVLLQILSTRL